jgi:hypothetical protein
LQIQRTGTAKTPRKPISGFASLGGLGALAVKALEYFFAIVRFGKTLNKKADAA